MSYIWPYGRERAITHHRPYLFSEKRFVALARAVVDPKKFFLLVQEPAVFA
jgi:hypothetical protein